MNTFKVKMFNWFYLNRSVKILRIHPWPHSPVSPQNPGFSWTSASSPSSVFLLSSVCLTLNADIPRVLVCYSSSAFTVDETDRDDWISLHKDALPLVCNCYSAFDGHGCFFRTLAFAASLSASNKSIYISFFIYSAVVFRLKIASVLCLYTAVCCWDECLMISSHIFS